MVTPPVPIFFSSTISLPKKRDDVEGCLKGVLRVFGGCCRVFGKIKYRYEIRQAPPPLLRN